MSGEADAIMKVAEARAFPCLEEIPDDVLRALAADSRVVAFISRLEGEGVGSCYSGDIAGHLACIAFGLRLVGASPLPELILKTDGMNESQRSSFLDRWRNLIVGPPGLRR